MPTTEADEERRRKRRDLDSILDAALDELDDDSDGDDDAVAVGGGRVVDVDDGSADADAATTLPQQEIGDVDPTLAVPYSLEYLSNDRRREEIAESRTPRRGPQFGPEPPPPRLPPDMTAQMPMPPPLDVGDAELASSLEGMMKQFTDELAAGGSGDGALDDMFKKMMLGEGLDSVPDINHRMSPASQMQQQQQKQQRQRSNEGDTSNMSTPRTSNDNGAKSNGTRNTKKGEPNVDESINRLLDGINRAATASKNPENLNMPPPGMMPDNVDPAQFEKLSEEMMNSIMGEFERMGNKNDSNDVVDGVMKQLLDKDLMYEPMREVCSRFPKWLAENKEDLSEEEYEKYGKQYQYFQRIVHVYETEPNNFDRLMELMQDIQEYGQPPVDIIKDLAPELEFDEEGMPIMDPSKGMGGGGMPVPGMPFPTGPGGEQCRIS